MPEGSTGESEHHSLKEMNRKRVLMASLIGTSITVKPGDILRIGIALSLLFLICIWLLFYCLCSCVLWFK